MAANAERYVIGTVAITGTAEIVADSVSNISSYDPPERTFLRPAGQYTFLKPAIQTEFRRAA